MIVLLFIFVLLVILALGVYSVQKQQEHQGEHLQIEPMDNISVNAISASGAQENEAKPQISMGTISTEKRIWEPSDVIPYDKYDDYINSINVNSLNWKDVEEKALTSVEKAFLKSLDGRLIKGLRLAKYWYYTYGVDYEKMLKLYFKLGLIEIVREVNLKKQKVPELKQILASKNLKKVGNKSDLIERIKVNFTQEELIDLIGLDEYFNLTERGHELVDSLPDSATYDLELEDECISLILDGKYKAAYAKVCNFQMASPMPSGLSFNWANAKANGWNGVAVNGTLYEERLYSACIVFIDMMGLEWRKTDILAKRFGLDITNSEELITIKENMWYQFKRNKSQLSLNDYVKCKIKKYQILAICDRRTCCTCAHMDGKVFNVADAEIGINFPPFEGGCRCTTAAFFDNVDYTGHQRCVRDEDGRSITVPDMNYEQWSREYAPDKYEEYFGN